MTFDLNAHNSYLKASYDQVGNLTWNHEDFDERSIEISRSFYTQKSLVKRQPEPKNLEVYALLSGLPFSEEFTKNLTNVQNSIAAVLGDSLYYWVLPLNFGVEYCVFKWPTDGWKQSWRSIIDQTLSSLIYPPFEFTIHGIQVHSDGCVVAKGYDNGVIFDIRNAMKAELSFLPKKQSGWAHVPIGRILEPLGTKKFAQLRRLINSMSDTLIASDKINSIKFIHETRWYMEEKTTLADIRLS